MFRLLLASGVVAAAMRPDAGRAAEVVGRTAVLGDMLKRLASVGPDAAGSLAALKSVEDFTTGLSQQRTKNATEYITKDDQKLLQDVIDVIQGSIYGAMDSSHQEEGRELDASLAAISGCNSGIAARLADDGDCGILRGHAYRSHSEVTALGEDVVAKTEARDARRSELETHKEMVPPAPACSDLPSSKTDAAWDAYFEANAHATWFQAQQSSYLVAREAVTQAELELSTKTAEYERTHARLEAEYCDWKATLTAGCSAFDECYENATVAFGALKTRLQSSMDLRIQAYKSGETIIAHVKFLIGTGPAVDKVDVDEARFVLSFPKAPEQGSCDLAELAESRWDSLSCPEDTPPQQCNGFESGDGVASAYLARPISYAELKGNFHLTVIVQVTRRPTAHYGGIFGGPCHTMGLWWSASGEVFNERQCGPHPGDSDISVQTEVGATYKIQITREGNTGRMTLSKQTPENGAFTEVGVSTYPIDYAYTNGITTIGMAHPGSEYFPGKIFCFDFNSDQ